MNKEIFLLVSLLICLIFFVIFGFNAICVTDKRYRRIKDNAMFHDMVMTNCDNLMELVIKSNDFKLMKNNGSDSEPEDDIPFNDYLKDMGY